MPITFKSRAHANITMLTDVATQMLRMMDFGAAVPGAIDAEDVPRALSNLKTSLAGIPKQDPPADSEDAEQPSVSLHSRALPLIQLLQASAAEQEYVRWE